MLEASMCLSIMVELVGMAFFAVSGRALAMEEPARSLVCDKFEEAISAEEPHVRDRLMCIGNARLDNPLCWTTDPAGAPLPHAPSGRVHREAASLAALFLESPCVSAVPSMCAETGGPRAGHGRGIERPPRLAS